ncbi:hypothetical protein MNBD_ALPHA08-593 [hydrothermal vent metagenome]|uniref:SH3b domain-containing protein n=1 Tax=hydrothermal vent metagenome TaxID=652676 RepID=A0A3B0RN01_9ZZZZ
MICFAAVEKWRRELLIGNWSNMTGQSGKRSMFGIGLVVASVAALGIILVYILSSTSSVATTDDQSTAQNTATGTKQQTGKSDQPRQQTGPSGLPVPRFVSLKRSKVNVRRGPSSQHKLAWIFRLKGLPVEIVAEFENWRRVRDSDGQEGWIYHSMLAGTRTVTVAPWREGAAVRMLKSPGQSSSVVANVSAGAVGDVEKCTGNWCQVKLGDYEGWINQSMLWGVYPNEKL